MLTVFLFHQTIQFLPVSVSVAFNADQRYCFVLSVVTTTFVCQAAAKFIFNSAAHHCNQFATVLVCSWKSRTLHNADLPAYCLCMTYVVLNSTRCIIDLSAKALIATVAVALVCALSQVTRCTSIIFAAVTTGRRKR